MHDGQRMRWAAISIAAVVATCAALTVVSPDAAAKPAPPKPRPASGHVIHGDIVPGRRTDYGAIHQHAAGQTQVTKVLVILGYWDKHDSTTPAKAKSLVITQANAWYRAASYGRQGLTGTATKWLRIPRQTCGQLNDSVMKAAKKAADKAHYHPDAYDRFVLYEPCPSASGAIGIGNLPGNNVILTKGGLTLATAVHEQGHNYGLGHANELVCRGQHTYASGSSCAVHEYDDFSSGMSAQWSSKFAGDFSAPEKDKLGWLSGHVASVPASKNSATVTLGAYESSSGTHAVKIAGSNGRTYWVEYRTGRGNDQHLPGAYRGVLIHMSRPDTTQDQKNARLNQSLLLHTLVYNPAVLGFQANADPAYLPPSSSWTTPDGIKISLTAETSGSAKITVTRHTHAGAPHQVTSQSATGLDTSATVSFHRATDGGTPIKSYTIAAHTAANGGAEPTKTITDYTGRTTLRATITGLTNDDDYTFSIRANSESGTGSTANTVSVTPTIRPPTAQITSPTGGNVNNVVTVNATGTPNPVTHAKITELDLIVDGILVDKAKAASAALQWDTGDAPGFAQNADHSVKVTAVDANGRSGSTTVTLHLTQSTGPNLGALTFTQGSGTPSLGPVDVGGSVTPHSHSVASVVVTVTDGLGTTEIGRPTGNLAPFSVEWDTLTADFTTGNQTVKVTATDTAGKISVVTAVVPLNYPSVSFIDPGGPTIFGNAHFTGTVTNNSPVDGLTIDVLRGGSIVKQVTPDVASGDSAPFDIVVNADMLSTSGSTQFAVKAADDTTRSVTTGSRALAVVRQKPSATIATPTTNSIVHDTVHFTGTATNNSAKDGLTISVKQGTTTIVSPTAISIDAGATDSYDVAGSVSVLTDATKTFTVTVTDNKTAAEGGPQTSDAVTKSLVVSHLPDLVLNSPIVDSEVFGKAHFTGTLKDHSATANLTVAISVPGATITPASQNVTVPSRGSTPTAFDVAVNLDQVPAGVDTPFTITVTDHDGLQTVLNRDLAVTHPVPGLTVDTPAPNDVVSGSTHFTGTATNNSGSDGLSLDIVVDDVPFATELLDIDAGQTAGFDVTEDVGSLAVGEDVFVTTVTDANNRVSAEDSRQLLVDVPPDVTVTTPVEDDEVSGIVAVTGTVPTDGSPVAGDPTVHVAVDGGAPVDGVATGGNFSVNVDLSALTGAHTITVSATDAAGVDSTADEVRHVTVVAPVDLSVTAPVDNSTETTGTLHFEGTVTNNDPDSAQTITVHIGYNTAVVDVPVADVAAGDTVDWTKDLDVSGFADGPVDFTVTASYSFGGTSDPVPLTVTIDNTL